MAYTKCKVLDGDKVIAENVDVEIIEDLPLVGTTSWKGGFYLPSGVTVRAGASLKLLLEDGRSGQILVTGNSPRSGATSNLIVFVGSGGLE